MSNYRRLINYTDISGIITADADHVIIPLTTPNLDCQIPLYCNPSMDIEEQRKIYSLNVSCPHGIWIISHNDLPTLVALQTTLKSLFPAPSGGGGGGGDASAANQLTQIGLETSIDNTLTDIELDTTSMDNSLSNIDLDTTTISNKLDSLTDGTLNLGSPFTPTTNTLITINNVSSTVLAANSSRKHISIQNKSTTVAYICFETPCTSTNAYELIRRAEYTCGGANPCPDTIITGITTAGTANLKILEG